MEINIINWYSASDKFILQYLGSFLRATRIAQNKSQAELAIASGIDRTTVVKLEGGGGSLTSFLKVMRTLKQLHLLEVFQEQSEISPLELAKMAKNKKQRVRNKINIPDIKKSDW